jgi:hypothetical protein
VNILPEPLRRGVTACTEAQKSRLVPRNLSFYLGQLKALDLIATSRSPKAQRSARPRRERGFDVKASPRAVPESVPTKAVHVVLAEAVR